MALVIQELTLDITPGGIPPVLHVTEYDENMQVTVQLQQRGQPFQIPTGTTVKIEGTLKGHPFREDGTPSGNTVTFMVSKNMTAYSGRAWTKIVLTKDSKPVSSCGFWLDCDRAGVEAGDVIGADGFEQQIQTAVDNYLDDHPPASGGMSEAFKQALLDCFANVAWINDDGQTYYDALYDAMYPPVDVLSISAVFTQGEAVIYDTDDLDTLKQYLVVTATMSDSTTQTVTNYTLSGTLAVGTSTITVSYGGKTTTFSVTVTHDAMSGYTKYDYIKNTVEAASSTEPGSAFSLGFGQEYTSPEYEHEIDVVIVRSNTTTSSPVCGLRSASGTLVNARNIWCQLKSGATGKLAATFSEQDTGFAIGANLNEHYVVKTTVENGNAVIYCNDVLASTHGVVSGFSATGNFMLFGATTAGNVQSLRSTVKVYGYKVKSISTGTLVCDFVPCTDSNGYAGVFDRVREQFYTHSDPQNYLSCGND